MAQVVTCRENNKRRITTDKKGRSTRVNANYRAKIVLLGNAGLNLLDGRKCPETVTSSIERGIYQTSQTKNVM